MPIAPKNIPVAKPARPVAPRPPAPAPAPGRIPVMGAPSGGGILNPPRPDPKMGPAPGGVTPGDAMTFKTHALVGRRQSDGHLLLIQSWPYCPTKDEIDTAKKDTKYPYVQFALVNAVGIWDAVEKPVQPIWTART